MCQLAENTHTPRLAFRMDDAFCCNSTEQAVANKIYDIKTFRNSFAVHRFAFSERSVSFKAGRCTVGYYYYY